MNTIESPIYQRVKQFVKIKRLTVAELASMLNIKPSTLGGKLNGSRDLDIDTLELISIKFSTLSAEWLLRGVGPMELTEPTPDPELKAVCIDQAKEIYQLKQRIAELEREKKDRA